MEPHDQRAAHSPPGLSTESLRLFAELLTGIHGRLGKLEAMSMANREAMVDRTEMVRREMYEIFETTKTEVFHRFSRVESWIEDIEERVRNGRGEETGFRAMVTGLMNLAKIVPLLKYGPMALAAFITVLMHILPTQTHAVLRVIAAWLRALAPL